MSFPGSRLRRLRKSRALRSLVAETRLSKDDLVMPIFIVEGIKQKKKIKSMPGVFQLSIDNAVAEAREIYKLGIPAVLLFGVPGKKDKTGATAYQEKGLVQRAILAIKKAVPELAVITDVCLCSYAVSGHCEVGGNDHTLKLLAKIALSHAKAGVDLVAPSAMMDGQVKAIRRALDKNGYKEAGIFAYSAKYASNFYAPFRQAAHSAPKFGDRKSYQMDFANVEEALREVASDIEEGADLVMVKPALAYLDVIRRVKDKFHFPVAAYSVSGEFSMLKAAHQKGWLDEKAAAYEVLTAIKRAGADIIITYYAKEIVKII